MARASTSSDRPAHKVVIATQTGVAAMNERIVEIQKQHDAAKAQPNMAAARIYEGVILALRSILAAGPAGTTYAELQMKVKLGSGRPGLNRQDQEEVMGLVRRHVTQVMMNDQERREQEAAKTRARPAQQPSRPSGTHSLARERLEGTKIKGPTRPR